mmetsp:Transcript_62492/g.103989  ORF Transcript_62492/g.103989 Transcript_62492/m.103989 type:complete len:259 (+) Transcript_62492:51-827(+)|eukprot:CAMPEP_0119332726 /NCGR_PEP_ID=MMETSP1333-20130426/83448_1 /TAXON_ID=418940 /ORGANISM="Scyphosphaera apsteinii, Strain RCC1455" /LENGTH=258 /DNA_ID=CAMNT_0007342613 /DNA_START=51 /DNA_END=827 /DNA_ORIENTATION=+
MPEEDPKASSREGQNLIESLRLEITHQETLRAQTERALEREKAERQRLERQLADQNAVLQEAFQSAQDSEQKRIDTEKRTELAQLLCARQANAVQRLAEENISLLELLSGLPTLRTAIANGVSMTAEAAPACPRVLTQASTDSMDRLPAHMVNLHAGMDALGLSTAWRHSSHDSGLDEVPEQFRRISPRSQLPMQPGRFRPEDPSSTWHPGQCGHAKQPTAPVRTRNVDSIMQAATFSANMAEGVTAGSTNSYAAKDA